MIRFTCAQCSTRFAVPENLAGKKARCKKCGQSLQVPEAAPTAAVVAATGMFRMGALPAQQLVAEATPPAKSKPAARARAAPSLRLAPISLDDIKPITHNPKHWEGEDSIEYELEKPIDSPTKRLPNRLPPTRRRLIWGPGGIAEVLLLGLRKISDFAYQISMVLFLIILLGIVLKQRDLVNIAAGLVILLNIVRLGLDGFVLVSLAFKKGPLHGVLFFIPPFTFYYLHKRGEVMKEALLRFLSPAIPIIGVALLYTYVPWLNG